MPYTPTTVLAGDIITSEWGNAIQQQYAQAKAELAAKQGDIRVHGQNVNYTFVTELDSSDSKFTGTKKADTAANDGNCVHKNTPTSGSTVLTDAIIDNLRLGSYGLMARLRSANVSNTTDSIRIDIQKNVSGTYTTIATRTIKPNEFVAAGEYKCFFVKFDYKQAKATNNQLKIVVTLLTQSTAYEVALDYVLISPVGVGVFIP